MLIDTPRSLPLPTITPVWSATAAEIAAVTIPGSSLPYIAVAADTDVRDAESHDQSLRIDVLGDTEGERYCELVLPTPVTVRGQVDWRFAFEDQANLTLMGVSLLEDASARYNWTWLSGGTDGIGFQAYPWPARVLRTISSSGAVYSAQSTPATWDGLTAAERGSGTDGITYPVARIRVRLAATGACTIWLQRVTAPVWPQAILAWVFDGFYPTGVTAAVNQWCGQGWPINFSPSMPTGDVATRLNAMLAAWPGLLEVSPHLQDWEGADPPNGFDEVETTRDELAASLRYMEQVAGVNVPTAGRCDGISGFQGNHGRGVYVGGVNQHNLGDELTTLGRRWARGYCSHRAYCVGRELAGFTPITNLISTAVPINATYGPFNLGINGMQDAEWATWLPKLQRAANWRLLFVGYTHDIAAGANNWSQASWDSWFAWVTAAVAAGSARVMHLSEIAATTWYRQSAADDYWMDMTGAWRRRRAQWVA